MSRDNLIFNFFLKLNIVVLGVTLFFLLLSVFYNSPYWSYFPVFPYEIPKNYLFTDTTFYSSYLYEFNLGFYVQLFMSVFAFMIYFAKKNLISFQFITAFTLMHSVLILIQADVDGIATEHIFSGQPYFKIMNWIYSIFFLTLFIANYFYDIKKAPHKGAFPIK